MAIRSGEIEGMDELIKEFNKFGETAMPYLLSATKYATRIVWDAARANVIKNKSVKSGVLLGSLKINEAKISKHNRMIVTGTVGLGNETDYVSENGKKGNYAVQVELGHVQRARLVGGGSEFIGIVGEKPFMRPAADENKERVVNVIINGLNKAIGELGDK